MIIEEMESYITCSKCDHGFTYSTLHTHQKFETMYDDIFKIHMGRCVHCKEGVLTVREAKFKVIRKKVREYIIRWQCLECGTHWTQPDNHIFKEGASIGRELEELKSKTTCPICLTKSARVLSMHIT